MKKFRYTPALNMGATMWTLQEVDIHFGLYYKTKLDDLYVGEVVELGYGRWERVA